MIELKLKWKSHPGNPNHHRAVSSGDDFMEIYPGGNLGWMLEGRCQGALIYCQHKTVTEAKENAVGFVLGQIGVPW